MKAKILELMTLIATGMTNLRAKANEALKDLGPLEQIEAGNKMLGTFRQVEWLRDDLGRMIENEDFKKMDAMLSTVVDEEITARVTAGQFIAKADLDAQLETAKNAGAEAVRAQFRADAEKAQLVATRRAEIATEFGEAVAASVPAATLESDNFATIVAAAKPLLTKATEDGFTAEGAPAAYKQLMLAALTSEEVFTPLHASLLEIKKANGGGNGGANPITARSGAIIPNKPNPGEGAGKPTLVSPY